MAFKRDILGFMEWYKNLELSVLWWPPTRFDYLWFLFWISMLLLIIEHQVISLIFVWNMYIISTGPPPCSVPKWKRANNYCNCSSCWLIHIFRFGSEQKPWNVILRLRDNHLDRAQRSLTSRKDIFCHVSCICWLVYVMCITDIYHFHTVLAMDMDGGDDCY